MNFSSFALSEQLEIDTVEEIYENEEFSVSVYFTDEIGNPSYQTDVEILFDEKPYQITESGNGEVYLTSPEVNKDKQYTITASKDSFTAQKQIMILDKQYLTITPEKYTVDSGETFAVKIADTSGNPIEGATVAIQSFGNNEYTNIEGFVWLKAPEERTTINIVATKEGYVTATVPIGVNLGGVSWWQRASENPNTFVIIAGLLLIFAIIFVNFRNRILVDKRTKEISDKKTLQKYGSHGAIVTSKYNDNHNSESKRGSKVEEIRISRPRKEKEIVSVTGDKVKEGKKVMPIQSHKSDDGDWFQGTDAIRYEIDKLTGEIDEENLDKWFEGIDDIRVKIDEKIKKKDKKKNEENT